MKENKTGKFQNWGLMLLSLLIAFVIWFLVVQINNPQDTSSFSNIQVKLKNTELLDQANKVYEILENTDKVRVSVRAPRSILQEIRSSDIVAEADVSKLTDINTIAITYDIENVDMASVEITGNNDFVKLNIEDKKRKYIPVGYTIIGDVTEGYLLGTVSLEQTRIEISGAESAVDQVKNALVEIDVSNATSSLSADMELHLFNVDGEELKLSNLNKQMDYVHVSAEVLPTKMIPVVASYQGNPAEGYVVTGDMVIEPQEILIAGTSRVLAGVKALTIPDEDISISEAESDVEIEFNASDYLANTVRLADNSYNGKIKITVPIEKILNVTLRVPAGNIAISHVPTGMEAEVNDTQKYVDLKLSGLSEFITPLRSADIKGVADISAWMQEKGIEELTAGVYSIPISFELDENITVDGQAEILIDVTEKEEF